MESLGRMNHYKKLLVVCVALNMFFLVSASVIGIRCLWHERGRYQNHVETVFKRKRDLSKALIRVEALIAAMHKSGVREMRDREKLWRKWTDLQAGLSPYSGFSKWLARSFYDDDGQPPSPRLFSAIKRKIVSLQAASDVYLALAFRDIFADGWALVLIGLLTFVTGVVLPFWLIRKMTVTARELHREVRDQVTQWVAAWVDEKSAGGEPYRNPEFWLKAVLLAAENFAPGHRHPLVSYLGGLAAVVRAEMEKSKELPVPENRDAA